MKSLLETNAQSVMIDLAFGAFLFVLLFAFIYSQWQSNLSVASQESFFEELSGRSSMACDSLLSTQGSPHDWFLLSNQNDINAIGLSKKKRVVDERKLSRFLSLDYEFARQKLRLSEFDFFFNLNSQGIDYNFGVFPDANAEIISLRRVVDFKGVESIVDCVVYRKA